MKGSYAGIMADLTLPNGATSGARIELDGVTGHILIYDASDNLLMQLAGDTGIRVPVPGDPTRYVEITRTGTDPVVRMVSGDGTLTMGASSGSPHVLFSDDGSTKVWEIGTNATGLSIRTTTSGNPSLSMIETKGVALNSSTVGNSVLFNNANGFLASGFASPWTPDTYTNLTMPGGWGSFQPCQYKRFPDGMVRLRGIVNASVSPIPAGTVLATLPAGYRPKQTCYAPLAFDGSATHGRALIRTTGAIEIYYAPNNAPALESIQFSTID